MASGRHGTRGSLRAERARVASQKTATVALGAGSALVGLHHSAARRASRADELSKLRVGELSIAIGVHAANDSEKLGLAGVVADRAEEGTEVEGVDTSIVVAVDAAVGGERAEVVAGLELALEDVEAAHQVDLLLKDVEESALDVVGERVEAADAERGAVQGDVPEQVVGAREQHLEEAIKNKNNYRLATSS